jgi:agmatinase
MNMHKKFGGIPEEFAKYEKSKIVLLPVPYDGTSTWQKGADKGFEAFLEASENMELYDIETDSEVYKNGISILDAITEKSSPDAMVEAVYKSVQHQIKRNKFVTLFGGEHSISIGAIRAFYENYENLTVLHLDAHADLRKDYEGSKYNHACAVYEASQHTNLIQIGIRSMDTSEKLTMDFEKVYFAHEIAQDNFWMDSALEQMTENVFITLDLDVFDPSIMPSTGTPEPGGLLWNETLEFLNKVFGEKNVVGFDIVELCPNSNNKAPDFLAAKLYYKMLSYKFSNNTMTKDFEEDFDDNFDSPFTKLSKFKDNDEF